MRNRAKNGILTVACLAAFAGALVLYPGPARATEGGVPACPCSCSDDEHQQTRKLIRSEHSETRDFITREFKKHELWFLDTFFKDRIRPALMLMAEQLSAVGMQQMLILGAFFDAQDQLDRQRLFQEKTALAHKNYQPSTGMCTFGTVTRSLAPAERNAAFTPLVLSKRSQDRALRLQFSNSGRGTESDRKGRLAQFVSRYCDRADNNSGLEYLCPQNAPEKTRNNDIAFTKLVDHPRTLDIDFSDRDATDDEQDVMALASNLYGHDVAEVTKKSIMEYTAVDDEYMDLRSIIAKRSVAENSFYAQVGLKSKAPGTTTDTTVPYMKVLLKTLGVESADDMAFLLGDRPSYYSQLELLSQRLYQDPVFFTDLYDKPANVERKKAALDAIGLMLDRDSFKSELRSEALISVWLETELMNYQESAQNLLGRLVGKEKTAAP